MKYDFWYDNNNNIHESSFVSKQNDKSNKFIYKQYHNKYESISDVKKTLYNSNNIVINLETVFVSPNK